MRCATVFSDLCAGLHVVGRGKIHRGGKTVLILILDGVDTVGHVSQLILDRGRSGSPFESAVTRQGKT